MIQKLILHLLDGISKEDSTPVNVYHQRTPQKAGFESIVFANVSTVPQYAKGQTVQDEARYQFDVYMELDTDLEYLITEIRTRLELYNGTFESVRYNFSTFENIQNTYNEELKIHRAILDVIIRQAK